MKPTDWVVVPPMTLLAIGWVVGILTGLIMGLVQHHKGRAK
jgi:thiamine transporter ThiT